MQLRTVRHLPLPLKQEMQDKTQKKNRSTGDPSIIIPHKMRERGLSQLGVILKTFVTEAIEFIR